MQTQSNRRQVSLRLSAWEKAAKLRDALSKVSGRKVTITDTIERGLQCLEDAHARGAWLSPKEAAPILEERHRREIASVLAQFIARNLPERTLKGVQFDRENSSIYVHLDIGDPVPLFVGGELVAQPEREA